MTKQEVGLVEITQKPGFWHFLIANDGVGPAEITFIFIQGVGLLAFMNDVALPAALVAMVVELCLYGRMKIKNQRPS